MISIRIKQMVAGGMAVAMMVMGSAMMANGVHADDDKKCPAGMQQSTYKHSISECSMSTVDEEGESSLWSTISTIIDVVLGLTGTVAVIMVIYGGFKIATSAGAADKVKSGKDTILYGVIGIIISLLAFAIVNFVLKSVFTSSSNTTKYNSSAECEAAKAAGKWSCTCEQKDGKFVCQ